MTGWEGEGGGSQGLRIFYFTPSPTAYLHTEWMTANLGKRICRGIVSVEEQTQMRRPILCHWKSNFPLNIHTTTNKNVNTNTPTQPRSEDFLFHTTTDSIFACPEEPSKWMTANLGRRRNTYRGIVQEKGGRKWSDPHLLHSLRLEITDFLLTHTKLNTKT